MLQQFSSSVLLKLILSFLFLFLVFRQIDLDQSLSVLSSARFEFLVLAFSIQIITILLSALRWRIVLENFGVFQTWYALTRLLFIGCFFNIFLPSAIGGDVFRSYFLSKGTGRGMSTTLTSTLLERSAGLCALLMIGLASSLWTEQELFGFSNFYIFLAISVVYMATNVMLFHHWTHKLVTSLLSRFRFHSLAEKMELVYHGLNELKKNLHGIVVALTLSLLLQLGTVLVAWLAAQTISLNAPFTLFLVFIPMINLTIMIPLTINGIGLRESAYYLLFSEAGVAPEMSVTLSLLVFIVTIGSAFPGLVYYSLQKQINIHKDKFERTKSP